MADQKKKGDVYFAQVEGATPRLIRTTDPRLAKRFVLEGIYPPKVEVRRPSTEEAMDLALDGVVIEDAMPADGEPAPAPLLDDKTDDVTAADLNDEPRVNPDDDLDPEAM